MKYLVKKTYTATRDNERYEEGYTEKQNRFACLGGRYCHASLLTHFLVGRHQQLDPVTASHYHRY